jgi:phospholipid/cholesterol/gamma-HCH transport system substrate-binding protein
MRRVLVVALLVAAVVGVAFLATRAGGDDEGYRVRVVFDNAFTVIEGLDVKVAGVRVGAVESLAVTRDNKAAVTLNITEPGFQDFRQDARCTIRPQSLIGEKFIECQPTQPRGSGQPVPPPLPERDGVRVLPVERTTRPVDIDLINNIQRLPERQRLAIIINELGAGLAGRGQELDETIRRANPALGATNEVLGILAEQNQVLARLAEDSDRVLAPLARDRDRVASFIRNANDVSQATAERREQLEETFARLPRFLEELRPTMLRLGEFSDEFRPVLTDLQAAAPDINRLFEELGPFSQATVPALESLGRAADVGRPALLRSRPVIQDLRRLTGTARPVAEDLRVLTDSLQRSSGVERIMDYIFYQVAAVNGFDQFGHYLRAGLIVNQCTEYAREPQGNCQSRFDAALQRAAQAEGASASSRGTRATPARLARGTRTRRGTRGGRTASAPQRPLRMPSAVLPGEDTPPQQQQSTSPQGGGGSGQAQQQQGAPAAAASRAGTPESDPRAGLLDYLLGGGS